MLKLRAPALASAVVIALSGGLASAAIYQYKDANGVIHITNARPAGSPKASVAAPRTGDLAVPPQDKNIARFTRYDVWIQQASRLYQIPEPLVRAIIKVESDYDARAVSAAGARGLMQLMPNTADRLQVRDIRDPRENIFGGVRLLRILANTFNGDLELTIAAYNAGEEAVLQHRGVPPYPQTRQYVARVTSYYHRYQTSRDAVEASLGSL